MHERSKLSETVGRVISQDFQNQTVHHWQCACLVCCSLAGSALAALMQHMQKLPARPDCHNHLFILSSSFEACADNPKMQKLLQVCAAPGAVRSTPLFSSVSTLTKPSISTAILVAGSCL